MSVGRKIVRALKEAVRYSRCRHEWTYWEPRKNEHGWTRTCTKCKVRETALVITDEIRNQT